MKIIHVLSGLTKGGGERVVVELANIAVQKGDEVTILAGWPVDPLLLQNKIQPGVDLRFIASSKKSAYLKILPWILANRKWICSRDVLHCHLTFGAVFGVIVKILLNSFLRNKKPIVVETYHAVGMTIPKFNRWLHSRMILRRDGLVLMAKDPYWNDFLSKHPSLRTETIPNGISVLYTNNDPEKRNSFLKETGIPENCKFLIGTISVLRSDRRPWLYVPVFHEIRKTMGDQVHFVLGGGGEEYERIEKLIKEQELSGYFHMLGLVNEPVPIISNMDVYVSVSVGETGGISMIEAAMCNVPVVAIQLTENYQTKEGDWVWSDTNTDEVAKRVVSLLQNEEERRKLARDQNEYVKKRFTSEAMYYSYDSFYKKIINPY